MSKLPKVFVRYERDAVTKRMVRASTESNLPPLDKVSELKTRIKELESELKNTCTQSQWISEELVPALNKCFKCKIGCDGMLMVAVDDYNELVDLINKTAPPKVGE